MSYFSCRCPDFWPNNFSLGGIFKFIGISGYLLFLNAFVYLMVLEVQKKSALRNAQLCCVTTGWVKKWKHMNSTGDLWNVSENFGEEILSSLNSVNSKLRGSLTQNFTPMKFKELPAQNIERVCIYLIKLWLLICSLFGLLRFWYVLSFYGQ
jgi:hypothetical protein